jgi:hypothetical protein
MHGNLAFYGRHDAAATVRRVAARRAGARLAVLLAVLWPVLGGGPARAAVRHPVPGLGLLAGPQVLRAAASRCALLASVPGAD